MKILIFIFFVMQFSSSYADSGWSVSGEAMENYAKKCVNIPSATKMETILKARIGARKKFYSSGIIQKMTDSLKSIFSDKFDSIDIDGFKIKRISDLELAMLLRLTTHNDSLSWLYKDEYKMNQTVKNGTLFIKRKCKRDLCKERSDEGLSYIFDLHKVKNDGKICEDVICASKKIFGDPEGLYILYALEKYGLNLSKYSDPNADPSGFNLQTLKAILAAAEATPKHLRKSALKDRTFYRFIKGRTLAVNGPFTIANASGSMYDAVEEYNFSRQIYITSHEIGHRADSTEDYDALDESREWLATSGFKEIDNGKKYFKDYELLEIRQSVSEYGDTAPSEDFAETYALYRFSPADLKKKSMQRYTFMKNKVFDGYEYTTDLCNGTKGAATKRNDSATRGAH